MLVTDYVVLDSLFLVLLGMVMGWTMYKLTNTWVYKQNLVTPKRKGELEKKVKGLLDKVVIDYSILKKNHTFLVDILIGSRKVMQILHRGLFSEFDGNSFGMVIYIPIESLENNEINKLENTLKTLVAVSNPTDASYYIIDIGVDSEKGAGFIIELLNNVFPTQEMNFNWSINEEGSVPFKKPSPKT